MLLVRFTWRFIELVVLESETYDMSQEPTNVILSYRSVPGSPFIFRRAWCCAYSRVVNSPRGGCRGAPAPGHAAPLVGGDRHARGAHDRIRHSHQFISASS